MLTGVSHIMSLLFHIIIKITYSDSQKHSQYAEISLQP